MSSCEELLVMAVWDLTQMVGGREGGEEGKGGFIENAVVDV